MGAASFPWEFLLFTAQRGKRTFAHRHPPRRLQRQAPAGRRAGPEETHGGRECPRQVRRDVFVQLRAQAGGIEPGSWVKFLCPRNPTSAKLRRVVDSGQPDIVHLAASIRTRESSSYTVRLATTWDGYLMAADADGNPAYATPRNWPERCVGRRAIRLYWCPCNFWNSACRVAATDCGRESAIAAIGFQDEVATRWRKAFSRNSTSTTAR